MRSPHFFIASLILIAGCVNSPSSVTDPNAAPSKPAGEWLWTNPELYALSKSGDLSQAELDHAFTLSKNKCKIQALQVSIPSPSCSTIPAPNCSGMTGFALGMCLSQRPTQQCNYSSVNAAEEAQVEIFESCLGIEGWEKEWISVGSVTDPEARNISSESSSKTTIQELSCTGEYAVLDSKTQKNIKDTRRMRIFYSEKGSPESIELADGFIQDRTMRVLSRDDKDDPLIVSVANIEPTEFGNKKTYELASVIYSSESNAVEVQYLQVTPPDKVHSPLIVFVGYCQPK